MIEQKRAYNQFVMFIIGWIFLSVIGTIGTLFVILHFIAKFW